jgi:hypothetical protein
MNILERILEKRLRQIINIDEMQCGFMPGCGTIDDIFMLRQIQEKYQHKMRSLYLCLVDLEKAFDRVPRRVIEWALRKKAVPERMVQVVMGMFTRASTVVKVKDEFSDPFDVKVGVHQGSVLSPILFITVMGVFCSEAKRGLLIESLYADDLVIVAESIEELRTCFTNWKCALEKKGMKVYIGKTKMLVSGIKGSIVKSAIDPCAVCGTRVKHNSNKCNTCKDWVHARCSNIKGRLERHEATFIYGSCSGGNITSDYSGQVSMGNGVEAVDKFNYLGNVIECEGGCSSAVVARSRKGLMKFKELSGILCSKKFPLKTKGTVYRICVRTGMTYGGET